MADESKYPTRIAPYGLRMPDDLKARIQAAAEAANRSMNAEIVATLEKEYPAPDPLQTAEDQLRLLTSLVQDLHMRRKDNPAEIHRKIMALKPFIDDLIERLPIESLDDVIKGWPIIPEFDK